MHLNDRVQYFQGKVECFPADDGESIANAKGMVEIHTMEMDLMRVEDHGNMQGIHMQEIREHGIALEKTMFFGTKLWANYLDTYMIGKDEEWEQYPEDEIVFHTCTITIKCAICFSSTLAETLDKTHQRMDFFSLLDKDDVCRLEKQQREDIDKVMEYRGILTLHCYRCSTTNYGCSQVFLDDVRMESQLPLLPASMTDLPCATIAWRIDPDDYQKLTRTVLTFPVAILVYENESLVDEIKYYRGHTEILFPACNFGYILKRHSEDEKHRFEWTTVDLGYQRKNGTELVDIYIKDVSALSVRDKFNRVVEDMYHDKAVPWKPSEENPAIQEKWVSEPICIIFADTQPTLKRKRE